GQLCPRERAHSADRFHPFGMSLRSRVMKSQAYFFAVLAAATGVTGAAAIWPASRVQAAAPAANVKTANFTFQQHSLTVRPAATVTWTNDDDIPHTVTANDKSFKSKVLDSGQS